MSTSNDLHDDSTVTPAADAGPRQPCPHVNTMGHEWESHCVDCGEVWKHSPPDYSVTTPVPQEAAPREVFIYGVPPDEVAELDRQADEAHAPLEAARVKATAPDSAMRVAREITTRWQKWQVAYAGNFAGCDTHGGPVPPTEREVAALIRERKHPPSNELLSKISRELPEQLQPMYCSMSPVPLEQIRSLIIAALQDVADDQYAQAYEFVSRAGEAGSERERESEQQLVEMSIGFQRYIEHVKVREQELKTGLRLILESYREYRRSCDDDWETETMAEASRLLGGESK